MKTKCWSALTLVSISLVGTSLAQITDQASASSSAPSLEDLRQQVSPNWQSTPLDWSSTEWRRTVLGTNALTGLPELQTNRYVELSDSLNYLDEFGAWRASLDNIQSMTNAGGAAALNGATKVYFSPTLGNDGPTIKIVTCSNVVLQIQPVALYLVDASGKSALLGSIRADAEPELIPPNVVVFKSALNGVKCDIRYTYTHGAFESDLIIQEQLGTTPASVGLDPTTAKLELVHLVDGPAPQRTPTVIASGLTDETLNFTGLQMPVGYAFSTGDSDSGNAPPGAPALIQLPNGTGDGNRVPVGKRWVQIGNSWGIVEDVNWQDIQPKLDALPPKQGAALSTPIRHASLERQLPALAKKSRAKAKPMRVAQTGYKPAGVILDYIILSSGSTYTFSPGTYFISGTVSFSSTVNFYGACVLKYAAGASLFLTGPINSYGSSWNPSIFTSMNDNAFGDTIAGSSGYPTYSAAEAVWLQYLTSAQTFNGLKIRWAQIGLEVQASSGMPHNLANSSIEWCQTGVFANGCGVNLQSSTKCNVTTPITGSGTWSYTGSLSDICNGNDPANGLPLT